MAEELPCAPREDLPRTKAPDDPSEERSDGGAGSAPANQRLITAALEAAANGIVLTDTAGRIVWVNRAFTRMTGYERHEALGRTPRILKSGRHAPEFYDDLWATIRSGRVWQGELVNRRKSGELYEETMTITPVRNAWGEITHFVAVKEDVTEKHLMQAQLIHAQRMESIGRLAGGIAHDFNNLLGAMLGYAELAVRQLEPGNPLREDIAEILLAGNRAAALTRQLLTFARADPVEPSLVDVNALVQNLNRLLQRVIGDDIQLVVLESAESLVAQVDAAQFEQVLMNLAVNARDAMPNGGALKIETALTTLPAHLARDTKGASFVVVRVRDTGSGMTPEVQKRAFEPFFTTKGPGRGTGLGLATCYGIISNAGGFLELASELGVGTTFSIYLPVSAEAPSSPGPSEPAPPPRASRSAAVLLVEDHDDLRRLLTRVLDQAGYRVVAAGDPVLAIELSRRGDFDIVVSDISLPGMNGIQLIRELTGILGPRPVVLMSGFAEESVIAEALGDEWITFLAKPMSPQVLVATVGEAIARAQGRAAS